MHEDKQNEKDTLSGVETTGHEWDGIKELNNPLPRWWLWVFYICILWSVGYWVVYPAWPDWSGQSSRGGTKGVIGWTQYKKLDAERKEILDRRAGYLERFHKASFDEIAGDPGLYAFAIAGGQSAFRDNCAACHGTGGAGAPGYPNLNDDDWIWGGRMDEIYQTIQYGVRMHDEGHQSMMPPYAQMLSGKQTKAVADYVHGLYAGQSPVPPETLSDEEMAALPLGAQVFRQNCAACHGSDGKGNREFGAPNLADAIWLKSDGNVSAIISQIRNPQHGMMPAWKGRLDEDTIRELTVYVHSLGGGE